MELCLELGVAHPDYLPLDARQLQDWFAFYEIQPWGQERGDLRQAVLVASVMAPHMPAGWEMPNLVWPYFEDESQQVDLDACLENIEAHKRRYNLS